MESIDHSFIEKVNLTSTAAIDVLTYDRTFSNFLYVLISLLCMALIVALTTGYLILHVCCCHAPDDDQCKACEQQERSVAESASNSDGFHELANSNNPNYVGSSKPNASFSVTTKIGVTTDVADPSVKGVPKRIRRGSTSDV